MNKREDMVVNKIAKNTTLWGKWFIIIASLILTVGMGATQALAATVPVDSVNNNFTMNQPAGPSFGGTNDVTVTWDGTLKTAVAVSGQVSNGSIGSSCPFFGETWAAHDVAIYGPGTYTVYTGCPGGSPGCGTGTPYTFTVNTGEIGGHMLFYWNLNDNIDVVDVWKPGSYDQGVDRVKYPLASNPTVPMWTGPNIPGNTCGSNPANKVWDWMSYDWNDDGVNGAGMVDGPFVGMNANFNWMATPSVCGVSCDDNNPCTTDICNKTTQLCEHNNNTLLCEDGNPCTIGDACLNGFCQTGTTPNACDDKKQCTRDYCEPATGCHNEEHCDDPTEPILIFPADGATGLGTTLELRWTKSTDPQNDLMTYRITYCKTPNAEGCSSVVDVAETTLAKRDRNSIFYAGGAGLLMIGMTFIGGITGRKKLIGLLIIVVLFAGGAFISCKNTKNVDQTTPIAGNEVNYMVQGLDSGTTYYWKIEADNGYGKVSSSPSATATPPTRSFTTR